MAAESKSIGETIFLSIPSHPKFISSVRALVTRVAAEMGFPEEEFRKLAIAIDEAYANIIEHAYKGDPHQKIDLTLKIVPDSIIVEIRDYGLKVKPETIHPRKLEDVRPGGLGTHFMTHCMDKVEFDTSLAKGTILRMVKHLPPEKKKC
ncbi:MAG: ATP-binding protein [Planctomycetota bacterium]|nr:ATP-binding protein [Planctomycetota bacterium]